MLKVRTSFPIIWRIRSNIALALGFTNVIGFSVNPYSVLIKYFLNSWPINSDTWSYVIYIGLGYLLNHVVSNNLKIDIAILLSYCVILNHHVTWYIMVKAFIFKFYFYTFLLITYGNIIYTHILFHGIQSDSLVGNLPYIIFERFVCCQLSQFSLPSGRRL